jgi:bacteriophage N4 adsorption protein B
VTVEDLVCVREYFPAQFYASVKQKSRWVVGIALQGWEHLGWRGDLRTKYMLFRDRKALVTNLVTLLGYLVVAVVAAIWLTIMIDPGAYRYPPLVEQGSVLWYVIIANAILLAWRLGFRAYCVGRVYGWQQAALSLPRTVWSNIINFGATCRAIRLYARYLRTGKLIAWDKTAHVYPDAVEVEAGRRKLGDLLLERRIITLAQLNEALAQQTRDQRLLGSILVDMGAVGESQLQEVLKAA